MREARHAHDRYERTVGSVCVYVGAFVCFMKKKRGGGYDLELKSLIVNFYGVKPLREKGKNVRTKNKRMMV